MNEQSQLVVKRFIEEAGMLTQTLGLGRLTGQIYAFLYLSPEARNLSDMQEGLAISKGSASTCVRQLEQWGAVRKVWIRGDRKDYYEANEWLGQIIKNAFVDTVGRRINAYNDFIAQADNKLDGVNGDLTDDFVKERFKKLSSFSTKARKLWDNPLLSKILK